MRLEAPGLKSLHGERHALSIQPRRWAYFAWFILIGVFAVLHGLHLSADFPNHTPWIFDWAKYTDEGWWGNAAVRAHLLGNWYVPGDFNPATAVPVLPALEWVVFCFTGVTVQAARGLAVAFFFANLLLSYLFLRSRGPRWMALLAVTFLVTSPFLYCFSRLSILEPVLTAFTLAALVLADRLSRFRRPLAVSVAIGVLIALMMLSKTSAVFLLPAVAWALIAPLWHRRRLAARAVLVAFGSFFVLYGLWMALVIHFGLLRDYQYLFVVNKYAKPTEFYWPLFSLWWSLRGGLWADRILMPLAGLVVIAAALTWRSSWSERLRSDPGFGSSLLAVAGYLLFMTYQNHPQPRYYAVVAFFSFFVLVLGIEALLRVAPAGVARPEGSPGSETGHVQTAGPGMRRAWTRWGARGLGFAILGAAAIAACLNAEYTLELALRPEYTLVDAAHNLARYIDRHPNGKRLLLSTSGDEIMMISHLPSICDDFGTEDLVSKLKVYRPGWFATWNDIDPGTLEDLHSHYSLEQVATFRALDHPERNLLVLFKLHPLPDGQFRNPDLQNLQVELPGDKIDISIQ